MDENIGYGTGWRLNYHENIERIDSYASPEGLSLGEEYRYKFIDGDGSIIYFMQPSTDVDFCGLLPGNDILPMYGNIQFHEGCGVAENGSGIILHHYSTDNNHEIVKLIYPNRMSKYFIMNYNTGKLNINYHQENTNEFFTIQYSDSDPKTFFEQDRIEYIVTSDGKTKANFAYSNYSGLLQSIKIFQKNNKGSYEVLRKNEYTYLQNKLDTIVVLPKGQQYLEYKKQVYDPYYSYSWDLTDTGVQYFLDDKSFQTEDKGNTKIMYSRAQLENYYTYWLHEYLDQVCFQQYQNDTTLGSDFNYTDEKIGSPFCG